MVMPQPFTTTQQQLVNYSYTDIADGTNVQIFYPCVANDAVTGEENFLTGQTPRPYVQTKGKNTNSTTETEEFLTFNLTEFNFPRTVKGTATLSFSHVCGGTTAAGVLLTAKMYIAKWDGTTQTIIGTGTFYDEDAGTDSDMHNETLRIDLTETHFAQGDVLRLVMGLLATGTNDYIPIITIGTDPTATDSGTFTSPYTTQTKLEIPFKSID